MAKLVNTTHLTDEHGHAARNKVPYCPGISVQVTARKALIRRVKESVVLFREETIRDGGPLLFRGVDTCRVVCARMQQEHRALRSTLQRRDEPIKVERDRFGVVIRIRALLDADILEDSEMIGCTARGSLSVYPIEHRQGHHLPQVGSLR